MLQQSGSLKHFSNEVMMAMIGWSACGSLCGDSAVPVEQALGACRWRETPGLQ